MKILRALSLPLSLGMSLGFVPLAAIAVDPSESPPAESAPTEPDAAAIARAHTEAVQLCERGAVALAANRISEAKRLFEEALAAYPAYPRARHELGRLEALNGRDAEARAHFEAALELAPDFVRARHALGELHRRNGRADDAERAYRQALATAPNDSEATRGLAFVHLAAGRESEALFLFDLVVTRMTPKDAIETEIVADAKARASALKSKGIAAKAPPLAPLPEPAPKAEIVAQPETVAPPGDVAEGAQGDDWGALGGEEPLAAEAEQDPLVTAARVEDLLDTAATFYAQRQYLAALANLGKARSLAPTQASIAYRQGVVEAAIQNFAAARRHWEEALRLGGPRPLITRHLGLIANRADGGQAPTDLRQTWLAGRHLDALALARGEDSPLASRIEADALMSLGMHAEALARYDELLGADATDRLALAGRAEALVMMGQKDAAETARAAFQGGSADSGWEPLFIFRRTELRRVVQASLAPETPRP